MIEFQGYSRRFEGWRGSVTGLPAWARFIVAVAALPGVVMLALSILAVGVSLAALLLLSLPVFRLVSAVVGRDGSGEATVGQVVSGSGRKQVDVKIIE